MIEAKLAKALNEQINKEMYSAYLYLSMSAWAESRTWQGAAHWFALQAKEEMGHAMKIYKFIVERGNSVALDAIARPPSDFKDLDDVFKRTLEHECSVTGSINALVDLAASLKDHATSIFLQWFVTEQVEEEAAAGEILAYLEKIGGNQQGLFMLDNHLRKRAGN